MRLVDVDGEILAHPTACPHRGGPLAESAIEAGCITCPWHGYRFDLRRGASADGRGYALARQDEPTPTLGGAAMLIAFLAAMGVASRLPQFHAVFQGSSEPLGVMLAAASALVA